MSRRRTSWLLLSAFCYALGLLRAADAAERPRLAEWLPPDVSLYVELPPVDSKSQPLPSGFLPASFQRFVLANSPVEAIAWDGKRNAAICLVRQAAVDLNGPFVMTVDDRLLLSSSNELLRSVSQRRADPALTRLSTEAKFQKAWDRLPDDQPWRMFLRLEETSRGAAQSWCLGTRLLCGMLNLPPHELAIAEASLMILGSSLEHGDFLAVSARPEVRPPELTAVAPAAAKELGLSLRLFAALAERHPTDAPLLPPGTIASLCTYIDRELLEVATDSLLDQERLARLAQASPEAKALLDGLFFGIGALDQIEPRVQIVVARQEFKAPQLRPETSLPAVAVVFTPKEPQRLKPALVVGFVAAVREANKAAAEAGRPRYAMHNQRFEFATLTATVTAGVLHRRDDAASERLEDNLAQDLLGRLPQVTVRAPLPNLTGRYHLKVVTVD